MRLITIFFVLFSITSFCQNHDRSSYVYAINGLKMRLSPEKESAVITKIPYGSEVKTIEDSLNLMEIEIEGLVGEYKLIEYSDTIGFIYSGYISQLPTPSLKNRWVELKDYLNSEYGESIKKTSKQEPNPYDSSDMRYGIEYSDKIDYYDFGEECTINERMILKDITINEAILFLTTFNANFRNIELDKPASYVELFDSYSSSQTLQYSQYSRNLTYKRNSDNRIIFIEICFDSEAGSGCARVMNSKIGNNLIIIEFSYSCS